VYNFNVAASKSTSGPAHRQPKSASCWNIYSDKVPTQRDRIWDAVLRLMEVERSFSAAAVREAIDGEPPTEKTLRNTLDAMEDLGLLTSEGGVGRAPRLFHPRDPGIADSPGGYVPRPSSHSGTFPYPGAKTGIADWIINTMPSHDTYVEVFGGAAGVLYQKPRSKYEIYNDHNEDVTQFFRMLRDRPDELAAFVLV